MNFLDLLKNTFKSIVKSKIKYFIKIFSYRSASKRPSSNFNFENTLKKSHSRNAKKQAFLISFIPIPLFKAFMVENIGVEPMTSCVQGRRSSQLS